MKNTAIALTLDEFNSQIANHDFQRTNMFSMHFATRPSSKSQQYLGQIANRRDDSIASTLDALGITNENIQNAITSIITIGTQKVIRKAGVSKVLMGAMTNRVVQSLLGELNVGTYLLEYFDMAFPTSGLLVQSCKIPDNHLNYEMDRQHNAPSVKITGRDFEPLVITFRMDSKSANYRAMIDWVNAVEDPITGLRGLPIDVEADIQINLHGRDGYPHTAYMFTGCIPMVVGGPQLSYEDNNQITTFDVTYAYRTMQVGAISLNAAKEWMENSAIGLQKTQLDTNMNFTSRLA
ncbi:baseplate tail tube initiator [Acinetobacter phage vB_AbaM_PhT2]|uniref:Baseplate tail tube initiator n=2 Tax=Hadassahvirus TaxID=2842716 RepID=A0A6B9SVV0_9CAUD|nr:tail tube [Acinetobacter phage AbTZA1]YP_009887152.1 tail tube [Acinetobacter phage vB_AbaM_PhT2]QQM13943.1 baseplate tail tube initiator [Acinetobacter phage Maestro]QQM18696.1 baseplate tail tube initiator [Acinetobacter phage Morttis]QQO96397.1 baseplate tail tube junction protein [Acinetobacter phage Minot]QQO96646.1 baseplate tail tube junction protein [Acinetobacter phage Mokit]UQS94277.1 baseplate tail tube initiator [Acinetobacter phage AB-Navy71]SSU39626.1 T4-like virus tail tube